MNPDDGDAERGNPRKAGDCCALVDDAESWGLNVLRDGAPRRGAISSQRNRVYGVIHYDRKFDGKS